MFLGFFLSRHYFQTVQISIKQKNKLITMMLNPSDQLPSKMDKKIEPRGKIAPKGKKTSGYMAMGSSTPKKVFCYFIES